MTPLCNLEIKDDNSVIIINKTLIWGATIMFQKILFFFFTFGVFSLLLSADVTLSIEEKNAIDLHYNKTIKSFMKGNEAITNLVYKSYAYVVFPSIGKGGLIFGGAYGEGRAYIKGFWVGDVILEQYTLGLQAGGQQYSEILFFKTKESFEKFQKDGFEDATQSSVVPIYSGISSDVDFAKDVQVFSSSSAGLMLEATTGAQNFTYTPKQ